MKDTQSNDSISLLIKYESTPYIHITWDVLILSIYQIDPGTQTCLLGQTFRRGHGCAATKKRPICTRNMTRFSMNRRASRFRLLVAMSVSCLLSVPLFAFKKSYKPKGLQRQCLIGSAVAGLNQARTITKASATGLDVRHDDYNKGICPFWSFVNNPFR